MTEEVMKTAGVIWHTDEEIEGEPYSFALHNEKTDEYLLLHPLLDDRQDASNEPDRFRTAWGASMKGAVERLGGKHAALVWTSNPISVDIPNKSWEYIPEEEWEEGTTGASAKRRIRARVK